MNPYLDVEPAVQPSYDIYWPEPSEDILWDEQEQGEVIQISDEDWEEEQYLDYEDSWIPYSSQQELGASNPQSSQQVILAGLPSASSLHFPLHSDLRQYYCQLHPHECKGERGGLQARESTCNASCAIGGGEDAAKSTLLAHMDVSGLGLALLVVVLIILGLNVGWDREKDAGGTRKEKGTANLPENPTPEQVKTRDKLSKAEQDLADKKAKEAVAITNATDNAVRSGKNPSEVPESRTEKKAREQREKAENDVTKAATAVAQADENAGQQASKTPSSRTPPTDVRSTPSNKTTEIESQRVQKDGREGNVMDGGKNGDKTVTEDRTREATSHKGGKSDQPSSVPPAVTPGAGDRPVKDSKGNDHTRDRNRGEEIDTKSNGRPNGTTTGSDGKNKDATRQPSTSRREQTTVEKNGQKDGKGPAPEIRSQDDSGTAQNDTKKTNRDDGSRSNGRTGDKSNGGNSNGSGGNSGGDSGRNGGRDKERDTSVNRTRDADPPSTIDEKAKEQQRATDRRQSAERDLAKKTKAEESVKDKARKDAAKDNGGRRPAEAPRTKEVIDAEDERKRAERKLKIAKEEEDVAYGRPVTSSSLSGPGKPSKAEEKARREEERKAAEEARQRQKAVDDDKQQTREDKRKRERDDESAGRLLTGDTTPADKKNETKEQKEARVAKEKAQQAYARAKKAEGKEEQRAITKATRENGNVRPAEIPETPEWKKAKQASEDARNKVDEATKKYDEVNAKVNAGQGGGGDARRDRQKNADSTRDLGRDRGETSRPTREDRDSAQQDSTSTAGEGALSKWGWTPQTLLPFLLLLPFLGLLLRGFAGPARIIVPAQDSGPIFSNPTSPAPKWVVNSPQPRYSSGESSQIHINNLQGHGSGSPNVVSSSPGPIVVEDAGPVYQENVDVHFTGPANPYRLGGVLFGAGVVLLPIFLDTITDFAIRQFTEPLYVEDLLHWLLLIVLCGFLLWKVNLETGLSRRYGPRAITLANQVRSRVAPMIVDTVQGSENLIWEAEDLMFGNGRYLLGMIIAAAGPVGLPLRTTFMQDPGDELSTSMVQLLCMMGLTVFGMLVANA